MITTSSDGFVLALLYDWHNRLRLHSQSQDIPYWIRRFARDSRRRQSRVAIMGAGTGRIAVPLAIAGHSVLAVDYDRGRLLRIPPHPRIDRLCANFGALPECGVFDCILYPYSTLQMIHSNLLQGSLAEARRMLAPEGSLWVDVSDHFMSREGHPWKTVLEASCDELGRPITERQRALAEIDHLRLEIQFLDGQTTLAQTIELWYFCEDSQLRDACMKAGLRVVAMENGYGSLETRHRRIYQLCRLP